MSAAGLALVLALAAPSDSIRFHPPAPVEVHASRDEAILGLGLLAAGIAGAAATHAEDKQTPRGGSLARRAVNWRFAAWGSVAATGFVLFSFSLPEPK